MLTDPTSNVRADPVFESALTFMRMFGLAGGAIWCTVEWVTAPTGPCACYHFSTRLAVAV